MRLKVPKFIDIESRIVGFLTLKQFLYILGGMGTLFVLWYMLSLPLFIIVSIPIIALSGLLAFYQYNGQPFVNFIIGLVTFFINPRLYTWKRRNEKQN